MNTENQNFKKTQGERTRKKEKPNKIIRKFNAI
jgi:hypothetical protein